MNLACTGIAQHVTDQQTKTGVKDAYTEYWIKDLINRARKMKSANPERSNESIASELRQWVEDHRSEIYNPFLSHAGKLFTAPFIG